MMISMILAALVQGTPAEMPAPSSAPEARPSWIIPDWITRATGDDLARVYPREAVRRRIKGIVMVVCRANAEGALRDCVVEQEAPQGAGLGEAALKLTTRFRMRPLTHDGRPVEGGVVRLPLQFRLP